MRPATLSLMVLLAVAGCSGPASPVDTPTGSPITSSPPPTAAPAESPTTAAAGTATRSSIPPAADTAAGTPSPPAATFAVGGDPVTITLEVADTPDERRRGLMGRRSLARDHGMVFVYPEEGPRAFWMKNTSIPLDMIFIDANGTVINVEHAAPRPNATGGDLRIYRSERPAKYVIEVRRGFQNRTGLGPGTDVRLYLNRSGGDP